MDIWGPLDWSFLLHFVVKGILHSYVGAAHYRVESGCWVAQQLLLWHGLSLTLHNFTKP